MLMRREPPAEELGAYFGLKPEEVAEIVLLLLVQEGVEQKLNAVLSRSEPFMESTPKNGFDADPSSHKQLTPKPVQS
jgi:hypothetical protein